MPAGSAFENIDDLSPISDRGATAPQRVAPAVREESPLLLPLSVTRRPVPKRAATPRGKRSNPFLNAEVLAPRGKEQLDPPGVAPVAAEVTPTATEVVGAVRSQVHAVGQGGLGLPPMPTPQLSLQKGATRVATRVEKSPEFAGTYREYSDPPPQGLVAAATASAPRMDSLPPLDLSPVPRLPHEPSPTAVTELLPRMSAGVTHRRSIPATDTAMIRDTHANHGRRSVSLGHVLEEMRHTISAVLLRGVAIGLVSLVLMVGLVFFVAPLTVRFQSEEDVLVKHRVHSLTQLQAIYDVPFMSLNDNETRCLYLRVLEDGAEELQRIVASLPPATDADDGRDVAYAKRLLRTQQVVRAHHHMRHRARLYARSCDGSVVNHLFFYPFRDAWLYGVVRHGFWDTLRALLWAPSLDDWYARLVDVGSCMRQMEQLPCPSLAFLEEKAERRLVAARGERGSAQERADEIARQIIDGSTHSNDYYNSQCSAYAAASSSRKRSSTRMHEEGG